MNEFLVIDLFSGAGGVTTGIEQATVEGRKVATVICAINHDELAIESHWKNHPHVKHFVEDIRKFDVKNLPSIPSDQFTKKFLWASLECTNHSNAKGGLSRDADSRTLAEHLPPYIKEFDPDYIGIENVREFKDWGPLEQKKNSKGDLLFDKSGKPYMVPDKNKKGIDFQKWIESICTLGYTYEMKMLNAADFGAHTSRKRLFILFAKEGMPIEWPKPTHDRNGKNGLAKWKPVKECLDFSDKGENIFGRKKNLCENTYKRIYAGLVKFIANGSESFLEQYNGGNERILSTEGHCNTITTMNRFGLVQPEFIMKYLGNNEHTRINNGKSVNDPSIAITTHVRMGLVQTDFLVNYHHSSDVNSLETPAPTLTTHDKLGLVSTSFIDMQHSNGQQNQSIDKPCGALLTVPKKQLVTVERFLDQQFGMSKPASINEPSNTLTANPKYNLVSAFLMNRQYNNAGGSIDKPCFTLIANMNKRPGYLIQLESGELAIKVEPSDSEYMRKIKLFMAEFGIVAIYMRMLRIPELKKITGFAEDYILEGTQADQKKFIGNAVPPVLPKAIFEALYNANKHQETRMAV